MRKPLAIIGLVFALATPVAAQQTSDNPVEISASQTLEWQRGAQKYIARGDAEIKQDGFHLKSDLIEAEYRKTPETASEIWKITATGAVEIHQPPQTAYGDLAVYNLDAATATLTGKDLRIVTTGETIQARDKIVYHQAAQKLVAHGDVKITHGEDTLTADQMTAVFKNTAGDKQELDHIKATGNVVITTPRETVTGRRGIYAAASQTATLYDNVRITSPDGYLEGARAEVDMVNGTSRLFAPKTGADGQSGRVTGRFFPKKKEANTP